MRKFFVLVLVSVLCGSAGASQEITSSLKPPEHGKIRVAFVLSEGAVMIDFAGPWEVLQDVMIPSRGASMDEQQPFELYTVSDSKAPFHTSNGMKIVPDYSFDDAPTPTIVVVPAQDGRSARMLSWLQKMSTQAEVLMSVCTGAFVLADAGLLNGKSATTHHSAYDFLEKKFPTIRVKRGMRWVQSDSVIYTAGGLSSGIDLALHVVELYFGRRVAQATADMMEYEGQGWKNGGKAEAASEAKAQSAH